MKKYLAVIMAISFFSISANSQVRKTPTGAMSDSGRANMTVAKHDKKEKLKELNLSKTQKGELKQFHQSMKQQRQSILSDASLNEQQKKEKMMQLRKEQQDKMNPILTPEQKQKWMQEKK